MIVHIKIFYVGGFALQQISKGENILKTDFVKKIVGYVSLIKYPVMLFGIFFATLFLVGAIFTEDVTSVTIFDGESLYELTTTCDTVSGALAQAGITVGADDKLNCGLKDSLTKVDFIEITRPIYVDVTVDNKTQTLLTYSGTISDVFEKNGIFVDTDDLLHGAELDEEIKENISVSVQRVTETYAYDYGTVDYETKYVADSSMYAGEERVVTKGVAGEVAYKFKVTLVDGVETERVFVSEEITKAPVNQVIAYGTKATMETSRGKITYTKVMSVTATAYTNDAKWGDATASGMRTRWGIIAVDPRVIPLGTKVYVKSTKPGYADYGFAIAADTGGSIKGSIIDLWMDNDPLCNRWGRSPAEVYILEDQSVDIFDLRNGSVWTAP